MHGAGHGGWCYGRVAPLLRAAGHDVYSPTLTGLGERVHLLDDRVDLDMHVADVVNVLRFEDLHDVTLVGHSYGGPVITGAADRAPDRVGRLVYLDAAYVADGQSVAEAIGGSVDALHAMAEKVDGVEVVLRPDDDGGPSTGSRTPATRRGCAVAWWPSRGSASPNRCG